MRKNIKNAWHFVFIIFALVLYTSCKQNAIPDHPRIIFTDKAEKTLVEKIKTNELSAGLNELNVSIADSILKYPLIEREFEGYHMLSVARMSFKRIASLAYAFRITNDEKYLERAKKELLNMSAFADWHPDHFLDVAEITTGMALGYDWLYHHLDQDTRDIVADAIINKGLRPSFKYSWWNTKEHNWNQVCHGAMSLGAFAIYEINPQLADSIITRAVKNMHYALDAYKPDGVYAEGAMYWDYGNSYQVLFIDAYQKIYGNIDSLKLPKALFNSAEFFLHSESAGGHYNFADGKSEFGVTAPLFWFAAHKQNTSVLHYQLPQLQELVSTSDIIASDGSYRFLPLLNIWLSDIPNLELTEPNALSWSGRGITPVSMHRTSWNDEEAIRIGIKGGTPYSNHAHMDAGSFIIDAQGIRWAFDPGKVDRYHHLTENNHKIWDKEQNGARWTIFLHSVYSHNTLVVNNQYQVVNEHAPLIADTSSVELKGGKVDMTPVYKGQLKKAVRTMAIVDNSKVLIKDELVNIDTVSNVRWAMLTYNDIDIKGNKAIIKHQGKDLMLEIIKPHGVTLETFSAQPTLSYEQKNPGMLMLGFNYKLKPEANASFLVKISNPDSEALSDDQLAAFLNW
jgi:hypothetical protein